MNKIEELSQGLDHRISDLKTIALDQITARADRAANLNELRTAIQDYTRTMHNEIIQACEMASDYRRKLEKAAEPPMLAILRNGNGQTLESRTLTDSDPLDCDHFAAIFSELWGFELEGETAGSIPDGTEDYSITITDDPEGVRCWSSANYMLKPE
jgi:hypothetical protein